METKNLNQDFLKTFLLYAVLPAVVVWIILIAKLHIPTVQFVTVIYGIVYVPYTLWLLKYRLPQKNEKVIYVVIWLPYLIYSIATIYLGFMMLFAVLHKYILHLTDPFIAAFVSFVLLLISVSTVLVISRSSIPLKWRKNARSHHNAK